MTIAELIAELSKLPPDTEVFYAGGDFNGDWQSVSKVDMEYFASLGKTRGVYLE